MDCTLCETPMNERADEFYFICTCCGAYVMDKRFHLQAAQEKARYEEHNNDVHDEGYQRFTAPITHAVLQQFGPAHAGLDYGCGTGPVITKTLKEKGYKVRLYDPYFHPDPEYLKHQYDYIFSCEVFEHFYAPKTEIEKLLTLLKPDGWLLIMTHLYEDSVDFRQWYYRKDPTHVFIYTEKTLHYIARRYGLNIIENTGRLMIFRRSAAPECTG